MTGETLPERDHSLDGTLADLLLRGELQESMRFIFPRRKDRLLAYGKLVIAPIIRRPLRSTLLGFNDDKGKQIVEKQLKDNIEWTLRGDRCSPEARENLQVNSLIESAFEDLPESHTEN
jgi:hypothetical protein